jgi:SMC interacting uncharacterized protein involved in chromosome segregation
LTSPPLTAKKSEKTVADLDNQRSRRDALKAEYEQLMLAKAPILELEESNKALLRDRSKFDEVLVHFESRKSKLHDAIAYEKSEVAAKSLYLIPLFTRVNRILMGKQRQPPASSSTKQSKRV